MNSNVWVRPGDCLEVLRTYGDESFDAVVTDPPYGLAEHKPAVVAAALTAWANGDREQVPDGKGFMGRAWDAFVPPPAVWDECLRVLKPGGHLLCFAGTRTVDLMGLSIRLAGFEMRDSIGNGVLAWVQGQGFPKGKGQLKPAWEPILLARKPFPGSLERNIAEHGTGALNIDGCRVDGKPRTTHARGNVSGNRETTENWRMGSGTGHERPGAEGRWPTNVVLTHGPECGEGHSDEPQWVSGGPGKSAFEDYRWECSCGHRYGNATPEDGDVNVQHVEHLKSSRRCQPGCPVAELDQQSGTCRSSGNYARGSRHVGAKEGAASIPIDGNSGSTYADTGGATRFFPTFRTDPTCAPPMKYQAKAPTKERPKVDVDGKPTGWPTVKPLELVRWLVRLVTPPGGVVLDPFAGTGTTGQAAELEGFTAVLIERDELALRLIRERLNPPTPVSPIRTELPGQVDMFDLLDEEAS